MSTTSGKKLTAQLIQELGQKAAVAPRKRINHNFHKSLDDPVQRLIVVMKREPISGRIGTRRKTSGSLPSRFKAVCRSSC